MEKYLNEAKGKRYLELLRTGDIRSFGETDDSREFDALCEESLAKQIELYGEPKPIPFEGKCRRCGRPVNNPVPEITHPEGIHEIASSEWCSDCNAFAMSMLFRESSAYRRGKGQLFDPVRGGR